MLTRNQLIEKLRKNDVLLNQYSVKSISVFGSIAREEAKSKSDIDLLVEFNPGAKIGLIEFIGLKDVLSDLLGVSVDLVTPDSLHPAMKTNILQEAVHVI
ncbi:MAG: nucleotidyltransferase family protein [Deltaproteobacteria bacterium]|jgi:uncharacterized protein|nr:nucleotidyltransferase family protein [Deltaproteobacteria bacterium]MBT4637496.1 nucleotidyltransferase family protein [Deltaproteobacteria bacterium]MBT6500834.1 nucleotidyltransferase family protein [Deltaproteobacteria bacterium]MBT6611472.1 nucleotidyltransferase family protein [Deltaproteobacteria bacterium]MBT7153755.1 nucleotidyltransferase family protein [Deltaproteobacteria bacterium]